MIKMLKSANNIYLVYEYLNGGSLLKMIEERGKIPEKESMGILFGVLKYYFSFIIKLLEVLRLFSRRKSFIGI
jgi:serine/threonine protein kinase